MTPPKIVETTYVPIENELQAGRMKGKKASWYFNRSIRAVKLESEGGMTREAMAKQLKMSTTTLRGLLMDPPCIVKQHGARTHANKKSAKKETLKIRRDLVSKYVVKTKMSNKRKLPKYPSPESIVAALKEDHGIDVCAQTVRNDLIAEGFKCFWRPTRAHHGGHAAARQAFAKAFKALGINVRKLMYYCDESVLAANDATCHTMWAKDISKVLHRSKLRVQNVPNIAIWAYIGHNFKSNLVIFDKKTHRLTRKSKNGKAGDLVEQKGNVNVTSSVYVSKCLRPNVARLKKGYLQQDGAASHNSTEVKDFMEEQGMKRLEAVIEDGWPSSSPDFNPIETIWGILKQRISEKFGIAKDVAELRDFARRAWATITIAEINATIRACEEEIAKHA
jgi:hypothetical protein